MENTKVGIKMNPFLVVTLGLLPGLLSLIFDYLAYPYLMAVSTIVTVPIVAIFFFTQRTFIEGISLTGLKG